MLKRENKKKSYNNNKKEGNNSKYVIIVDDFFVVCDSCVENVNLSCDEMDWVVDSDASTHATSRFDLFQLIRLGTLELFVWEIMGKLMSSEYEIFVSKLAMRLL